MPVPGLRISGALVLLFAGCPLLGGCSVVGIRSGSEEASYRVVAQLGDGVEVRRYDTRLSAETALAAADDWNARSDAFRKLAGYIFGANRAGSEIAMTTPVETAATPGVMTMRFFMPAGLTREMLPESTDPRIRIVEVRPELLAVLRFSGFPDVRKMAEHEHELETALDGSAWRATGGAVGLYYDPPWTIPFLRRNEVALPVAPRSAISP